MTSEPIAMAADVQRQVLFASLLRYEPAALAMRDSALERFVMGSLIGSNPTAPVRIGTIQQRLQSASGAPALRNEAVQAALDRLIATGKVGKTETKKRHAYYLTDAGGEEVKQVVESGADLFDRVLKRMLRDVRAVVPFNVASGICSAFFCECFARFGKQIANFITGRYTKEDFVRLTHITEAFNVAMQGYSIPAPARESLRTACINFLHSKEPDDQRLMFYLTHGYYFIQLLGYETGHFDPLAKEAFEGAVLYVDTNVLLPAMVQTDHNAKLFYETVQVARKIGIDLRVTRATINETRRVAEDRRNILKKVLPIVPEQLLDRHADPFLIAFNEARERQPNLTVDEFMQPFDALADELHERFDVTLEELIEDEIVAGRDCTRESQMLQEEAVRTRGWRKSEATLIHDVAHLMLVIDARAKSHKTWFLTRDRSVAQAAARLVSQDETPLALGLLGFLCTMSPFLAQSGEQSLVAVFSSFLTEQVFPLEQMFDTRDLAVLADLYDDVFATPPEQLIPALDFVKRQTLKGRPFNDTELPQVARALRGFLAKSGEERTRLIAAEADRLQRELFQERFDGAARRSDLQRELDTKRSEAEALGAELDALRATAKQANTALTDAQDAARRHAKQKRAAFVAVGAICAAVVFAYEDTMAYSIAGLFSGAPSAARAWVQEVFRLIGVLALTVPSVHYIRNAEWSREISITCAAALVLVGIVLSGMLDTPHGPRIAQLVTGAIALATLLIAWRRS